MSWFLIILFLLLVVILLIFTIAIKVRFAFDSNNANLHVILLWLYPFLKAVITNEERATLLTVYVFNKSILKRTLKSVGKKGKSGFDFIKRVHPTDIDINAEYGFTDPSVTGIMYGAISAVSKLINVESIRQNPDFVTINNYIYADGTAKINMGSALINLARSQHSNLEKYINYN